MGLGYILRVSLGMTILVLVLPWFNKFFYSIFYILKVIYSYISFVFSVLGATSVGLGILYYLMVYVVIGVIVLSIDKFFK